MKKVVHFGNPCTIAQLIFNFCLISAILSHLIIVRKLGIKQKWNQILKLLCFKKLFLILQCFSYQCYFSKVSEIEAIKTNLKYFIFKSRPYDVTLSIFYFLQNLESKKPGLQMFQDSWKNKKAIDLNCQSRNIFTIFPSIRF